MRHTVMRDDGTVLVVEFDVGSSKGETTASLTGATQHDDEKPVALTRLTKAERERFEEECAEVYDDGRAS